MNHVVPVGRVAAISHLANESSCDILRFQSPTSHACGAAVGEQQQAVRVVVQAIVGGISLAVFGPEAVLCQHAPLLVEFRAPQLSPLCLPNLQPIVLAVDRVPQFVFHAFLAPVVICAAYLVSDFPPVELGRVNPCTC